MVLKSGNLADVIQWFVDDAASDNLGFLFPLIYFLLLRSFKRPAGYKKYLTFSLLISH